MDLNTLTIGDASFVGTLLVGIGFLWRMLDRYSKKIQEDSSFARNELIATLNKKHDETVQLLKDQNAILTNKAHELSMHLESEKNRRDKERDNYVKKLDEIMYGYRKSMELFNSTLKEMALSINQCAKILEKIPEIMKTLDKLQENILITWNKWRVAET